MPDSVVVHTDEIDTSRKHINDDSGSSVSFENPSVTNRKSGRSAPKEHLSTFEKICFGIAALPFQMYCCAIGVFATVFLLDVAKIPPSKNLYILFLSRAADMISAPLYGYMINKTKITRFGKMRLWLIVSTPISAINYLMLWYIPDGFTENQLFVWFLFWHCAIFIFTTGNRTPHMSMTMYLCSSLKDREMATVFRTGFEIVGLLVAIVIQGPLIPTSKRNCLNGTIEATSNSSTILPVLPISESIWDRNRYFFIAAILTVIWVICNLMCIIFVKEDPNLLRISENKESTNKTSNSLSYLAELKRIFTFRPFLILFFGATFCMMALQIIQNMMELYFKYSNSELYGYFNYIIIGLLVSSVAMVPLWRYLIKKTEKRYLVMFGNMTVIPLLIACFFIKKNQLAQLIPFFVLIVIGSNAFTSVFVVPWTMLPEVLDEYFLVYKYKPDALFYTYFVIGAKILTAIYSAVNQLVLDMAGYKSGLCEQVNKAEIAFAIDMVILPPCLLFLIVSSIIIYFYPISSQRASENSTAIRKLTEINETGETQTYDIDTDKKSSYLNNDNSLPNSQPDKFELNSF